MLKKSLCILLVSIFLFCIIPFSASAETVITQKISAINKTRLTDYLVIFTRAAGNYTATNVYGTEATVTDGIVTAVGGNNSYIPEGSNSFVISGHGIMSDWVADNVKVGMKASYNSGDMVLTLVLDDSSLIFRINSAKLCAEEAKAKADAACIIYGDEADSLYNKACEEFMSVTSPTERQCEELVADFELAAMLYSEREASEYRGVWLRPTQTSKAQVETYVKQCVAAGINMISIETMYAGTMIYPTPEDSLFSQNPIFGGFDVLGAFVEICHKYDVELHCWMPVFYSGNTSNSNWRISVAAQKPEWQLKTNNGSNLYSYESSGMVFLNPALDEVQDFLAETYTHLLENYDIDGFQLDYIRYRDRYGSDDFGYDSVTIAKFKEAYPEYVNYGITYNTSAVYWHDWVLFRTAQVTRFVERMRDIIDTVAPEVILSADVGASISNSYSTIYQDSTSWLENGWLDMIHPMAYGSGYGPYIETFIELAGDSCMVVPGLGIYIDEFDGEDMALQAYEMQQIGCEGVVYFQTAQYFGKGADEVLKETLYTEATVAPALDNAKTVAVTLGRLNTRLSQAKEKALISETLAEKLRLLSEKAIIAAEEGAYCALPAIAELRSALKDIDSETLYARLERDALNAYMAAKRSEGTASAGSGDVDGNGVVDTYDYMLVKRAHFKTYELDTAEMLRADVTGDGIIDTYDYMLIKRIYFGTYTV